MTDLTKKNNIIYDPFDDRNFTQLFDELYVPLCQYCLRLVNDTVTAEDIVQEQFIYFWENRKRLIVISSPSAYLYKSVKNKSLNYLGKQMRNFKVMPLDELKETPSDQLLPSVNDLLENKELNALLERALENLPVKCRTIFTMK